MKTKRIVRSGTLACSIGLSLVVMLSCSDKPANASVEKASVENASIGTGVSSSEAINIAEIQKVTEVQKAAEKIAQDAADNLAIEQASAEQAAEAAIAEAAEKQRAATKLAAQQAAKLADANAKKEAVAKLAADAVAVKLAAIQAAETKAAEAKAETVRLAAIEAAKIKAAIAPQPVAIVMVAQNEAGNKVAGAVVFKKCRACHSNIEGKRKVGPSLYGVVGRTPGTLTGYKYSTAMKTFGTGGATWDAQTLSKYLTSPRTMLPKVKMIFPGLKDQQDRLDIIAYLDSLDDN